MNMSECVFWRGHKLKVEYRQRKWWMDSTREYTIKYSLLIYRVEDSVNVNVIFRELKRTSDVGI